MATVVLRVQGEELDLDSCLAWIPESSLEAKWRVGDRRLNSRKSTTCGFTLLLFEGDDNKQVAEEVMKAFVELAPRVAELVRLGASVVVDVGLMVSPMRTQSVKFEPAFLRSLDQHGVSLIVSAYPCSD